MRWIFDIELSFDKARFYILVKRKLSYAPISESLVTKAQRKIHKRETKS